MGHRLRPLRTLCALLLLCSCGGPAADAPHHTIYVARGMSLSAVTDSLVAARIVAGGTRFLSYARLRGLATSVRPGLYEFPEGEQYETIVRALMTGRTEDLAFTVPEGLTVAEIADLAARRLRLARDSVREAIRDSFLAAARDPQLRADFGIVVPANVQEPLEGYLMPETYRVAYDATPRDIVRQMLRQSLVLWDSTAAVHAAAIGLTRHEVLTLASIVEAEARSPGQRRRVAGVYLNRLRRGMPLQSDPTVMYAVGERLRRVLFRHLEARSPYNTYLHSGLPPGPISNPGRSSIDATLNPESHGWLFFVATPDGRVMYSRTGAQHADSANIARDQWALWRDSIAAATRDSLARARAARDSARQAGRPPTTTTPAPARQ